MSVAQRCPLTSHYLTPCPGREHRPILLELVVAQNGVFVGAAPGFYADGNTLYLRVDPAARNFAREARSRRGLCGRSLGTAVIHSPPGRRCSAPAILR